MGDTERVCFSGPPRVHPSECDPVAGKGDIATHLNCTRFKLTKLERETFAGCGGNPVSNVIFTDRRGTDCRPTEEILVP